MVGTLVWEAWTIHCSIEPNWLYDMYCMLWLAAPNNNHISNVNVEKALNIIPLCFMVDYIFYCSSYHLIMMPLVFYFFLFDFIRANIHQCECIDVHFIGCIFQFFSRKVSQYNWIKYIVHIAEIESDLYLTSKLLTKPIHNINFFSSHDFMFEPKKWTIFLFYQNSKRVF